MKKHDILVIVMLGVLSILLQACSANLESKIKPAETAITPTRVPSIDRETKIPMSAVKITPNTDEHPPLIYSIDYDSPVPVPGEVNTAGAEDSPFITPDGNSLYFVFTPDVNVPVEQQLLDEVTGIYVSQKIDSAWRTAQRVILQDPGKLSLDGCEYIQDNIIWFCSTRAGYTGMHWFTAEYLNGSWRDWTLADFDPAYQVGELYFSNSGTEVYFASERPGGQGGRDIWMSSKVNGTWQQPVNIRAVNTADGEGWPALNQAGDELWFTRSYGIWRSKSVNGEWQPAELVASPLAGEPSLDENGNLYFVHHYYHDDTMIEADIYVAYKR